MRVGLVIYGEIETLTGGYLYDSFLASQLRKRGHDVEVLSLGLKSYVGRLLDNVSRSALRALTSPGWDLLLQDELCHPSLWGLNRRCRRQNAAPVVSVVHHLFSAERRHPILNRLLAGIEKRYLDTVDGFVFNSRATRDAVQVLSPGSRSSVIAPPGGDRFRCRISLSRIRQRVFSPGPLRLLFLGQVVPRKGLLELIQGLAGVPPELWQLDVLGSLDADAGHVRKVRQRTADLGLEARVRLCGEGSDEELVEALTASHLLCMPFAWEGFGIVTLEAMGFAMPVIGSTRGATPELIRHGVNGLLVEPGDWPGLQTALISLADDRERLFQLSEAALESWKEHPSWSESMDRAVMFLESMAGPGRASSPQHGMTVCTRCPS